MSGRCCFSFLGLWLWQLLSEGPGGSPVSATLGRCEIVASCSHSFTLSGPEVCILTELFAF